MRCTVEAGQQQRLQKLFIGFQGCLLHKHPKEYLKIMDNPHISAWNAGLKDLLLSQIGDPLL